MLTRRHATRGHARRRLLLAVLVLPVLVAGLGALAVPAQAAKEDCQGRVNIRDGVVGLPCQRDGYTERGDEGRDASNVGTGKPSCELVAPATFCLGSKACYIRDGVVPFAPPQSPPPKPDAQWVVRICIANGVADLGEAIWLDDGLPVEPPLIVQAQEALGLLKLPKIGFETNPSARSIVNIETRFTATGDVGDPITSSSSFDVVAVATLKTWHIETGEGVTLSCSRAELESGACAHTYRRASVGQPERDDEGQPAYAVRSYGTWSIEYLDGDDPIDIPGTVNQLNGPSTTVPVAVAEIQSVVTGG